MRRGAFVLVAFPFTDLTATKVRPALVVSPTGYQRATGDVILAAVSSVLPRRPLAWEVIIAEEEPRFRATGLKRTSAVLCGKLFAMEQRLVLRELGRLGRPAQGRVDRALAAALGLDPGV